MEGGEEGDSGLKGGAVSQPASARPAENVGDGGREGRPTFSIEISEKFWKPSEIFGNLGTSSQISEKF